MIADLPLPDEIELLLCKPVKPMFTNYSMKWLPEALRSPGKLSPQSSQSSLELAKKMTPPKETTPALNPWRKSLRRLTFSRKHHSAPTTSSLNRKSTFKAFEMLTQISTHFLQKA